MPQTLRLLCLDRSEPEWMPLTVQLDRAGCAEPRFRWVSTIGEGLTVLRDQSFDLIVICDHPSRDEAKPNLEYLTFALGVRGAGHIEPILLVVPQIGDREISELCQLDCDLLVTNHRWHSTALVPMIRRLVDRLRIVQENRRLALSENRRLVRERDEAEKLLTQQRRLLEDLEGLAGSAAKIHPEAERSDEASREAVTERTRRAREIDDRYGELLRGYVMMGSRNLAPEIARIAERITDAGMSPRDVLQLHLERVESLVEGLGKRSARHVLSRADLLALELMVQISECNSHPRLRPPHGVRRVRSEGGIDLTSLPGE